MKSLFKVLVITYFCGATSLEVAAQLSANRIADIAEMKVERFQNILDLKPAQAIQLQKETVLLLSNQASVANSTDILAQINTNLETYYKSLSTLTPQQLSTLRLFDSLDRAGRRQAYADVMEAYGQSSDFAVAIAAYNWNVVMPILVSYRKDLDRFVSPEDQATIATIRDEMIAKYNFMVSAREHRPSADTEAIVTRIQAELLSDLLQSGVPRLLQKYEDRLNNLRSELKVHEQKIHSDLTQIFNEYVPENIQSQMSKEADLIYTIGISKLLRDAFFLLMDGGSRAVSFKVNALHLMASESQVIDQF